MSGKLIKELAAALKKKNLRIVFAESCTGGALASQLSEVPGVSEFLAGSFVVYREESKQKWLGVKTTTLKKYSAVSEKCAQEMHSGALRKTPEADYAVSVTGYLGPGNQHDGLVFVTYGTRRTFFTEELWILKSARPSSHLRLMRKTRLVRIILKTAVKHLKTLR